MMNDAVKFGCAIIMLVCAFFFAITCWVTKSAFEASSYNRVTGNNVSTWDAMFIELRVQDSPDKD